MDTNDFHHTAQAGKKTALFFTFLCIVAVLASCAATPLVLPSPLAPGTTVEHQPTNTSATILPVTVIAPSTDQEATPLLPNPGATDIPDTSIPITASVVPIVVQTVAVQPVSTEAPATCTLITGYVIGGGDTTPAGLADAPRRFAYTVRTEAGVIMTVSYRTRPPSPTDDKVGIRLDFHAGEILIGDYLKACGNFDQATQTIVIAEEGHYIETYSAKP